MGDTDFSSDRQIGHWLTCFTDKVLISHGEHTATPFIISFIYYLPAILKKLIR